MTLELKQLCLAIAIPTAFIAMLALYAEIMGFLSREGSDAKTVAFAKLAAFFFTFPLFLILLPIAQDVFWQFSDRSVVMAIFGFLLLPIPFAIAIMTKRRGTSFIMLRVAGFACGFLIGALAMFRSLPIDWG